MKIQIVLFDGFGELVAFAPFEVLKRANECGAEFQVEMVSSEPKREVVTSFGVKVMVDDYLRIDNRPDLLIVPGGGWNHKANFGAKREAEKGDLPKLISELHAKGTIIAGVCTGGMLIAASGILEGEKATTHFLAKDELKESYGADVLSYRIVDNGNIITARGVTSGVDLGLWIIERFAGANIAAAVESRMEYERRGVTWRNP
ncbi:DJ-1/PfpI family protein [Bacillus sp. RG28]|uniref:DJ-1/PfpI family protein n=1 Tax=Gottfriedia endophytica TaxID=2820819 RepID=A0A940NH84_9BACI|nr:DJ-1/PfpI family protein [Gottfriedia endophytica]MBP0723987.1 DJ-1/PfpI family protein [Gottfriedia endophytica]